MTVLLVLICFAQLAVQLGLLMALAGPKEGSDLDPLARVAQIRRATLEAMLSQATDERSEQQ